LIRRANLDDAVNIEDIRQRARRRVPRVVWDCIDGGAGDEVTLAANRTAFEQIWFRPRQLVDVGKTRDLTTTVFGEQISMPLMLDPCGFARMSDSQAELAVARAAGRAGTVFAVSSGSSYTLEEIAAAALGPLWYQLYLIGSLDDSLDLVSRARDAGYRVLCLTIDTPIIPKRERDIRNELSIPLKMTPKLLRAGMSRPRWAKDFLLGKVGHGGQFGKGVPSVQTAMGRLSQVMLGQRAVTPADVEWLRGQWPGKLVIKGIQRPDECEALLELGVDGFIVSNHGGRNLDGLLPSIEVLPEVVQAVDGRAEVYIDSGIRRGTDVVKALALGARACLVGRPYMFGLAAGGEAGVERVLEIFRGEIDQALALTGCTSISDIDPSLIQMGRPGLARERVASS
jgi:isopentenyl diphosphate isomerase/L-lactate dehydrogenase-like FMN-dependent dehydrogenase